MLWVFLPTFCFKMWYPYSQNNRRHGRNKKNANKRSILGELKGLKEVKRNGDEQKRVMKQMREMQEKWKREKGNEERTN